MSTASPPLLIHLSALRSNPSLLQNGVGFVRTPETSKDLDLPPPPFFFRAFWWVYYYFDLDSTKSTAEGIFCNFLPHHSFSAPNSHIILLNFANQTSTWVLTTLWSPFIIWISCFCFLFTSITQQRLHWEAIELDYPPIFLARCSLHGHLGLPLLQQNFLSATELAISGCWYWHIIPGSIRHTGRLFTTLGRENQRSRVPHELYYRNQSCYSLLGRHWSARCT